MRYTILFISSLLFFLACNRKPKYEDAPEISFNEDRTEVYERIYSTLSGTFSDSIKFAIDFKDGDGDLGLDDDDRLDKTNINFVMIQKLKVNGAWIDTVTYEEQFQLLSAKELKGPIDGTLYNIKQFMYFDFAGPRDTIKFLITIKDRAGHYSNTIETPEYIIKQ